MKDLKVSSVRTCSRLPMKGNGVGPGGSFPALCILLQAEASARHEMQMARKMVTAPASSMVGSTWLRVPEPAAAPLLYTSSPVGAPACPGETQSCLPDRVTVPWAGGGEEPGSRGG